MPSPEFGVIGHRRWPRIKSQWTAYLPDADKVSGLMSVDRVSDIIRATGMELPKDGSIEVTDIPALRTSLFSEAAFDIFSACSTISAAERAVDRGSSTIGVALGYYAMLFATRAWLSFMGLARVEIDSKFYVVDVWPDLGRITAQGRPVVWPPRLVVTRTDRFEHDFHWRMAVFVAQRTFGSGAEVKFADLLKRFGDNHSFSQRRNAFLYRRMWRYDDLLVDWSASHVGLVDDLAQIEFEDSDLDLKVGQLSICAVFDCFFDIASQTAATKQLSSEVKKTLSAARHPIMFRGGLLPMLTRLTT